MSLAAGADGHADADLARPLGDRDQHDVHDADAADDAARWRRWRTSISVSVPVTMPSMLAISVVFCTCEIERLARAECGAARSAVARFRARRRTSARRAGRDDDRVDVVERRALQPLSHRRVGHQQDVVLIVADHVGALALEHADDAKGMFLMRIVCSSGFAVWNSLRDERLADDADLGGRVHVALGEEPAAETSCQLRTVR